jgi:predicted nucleic acid-binding Zn ribbon protein
MDEIIQAILARTTENRWGIGTAAMYLKSVEPYVLGAQMVPADQWPLILKEAEQRLTWCDEGSADTDLIAKSVYDGTDLPEGFCASFDCILTSNRKDRDGDILEPKGLSVDPNMPLLWQHIPAQPIGRLFKVLNQDDTALKCRFGILDTAFGRDVALMTKTGCLRMSHGFKPFEYQPVAPTISKDGMPCGWHVLKGEIREGSEVTIPSNVDGLITAYSQGKLKSDLGARWAKGWYDARPTIVPGADLATKAVHQTADAPYGRCPECGGNGIKMLRDGSEATCENGHTYGPVLPAVSAKAAEAGQTPETEPADVAASAAPVEEKKGMEYTCPKCGHKFELVEKAAKEDEMVTCPKCSNQWDPKEKPKADGELLTKAGKVLSAANEGKIQQAYDLLGDVLGSAKASQPEGGMTDVILASQQEELVTKYYDSVPMGSTDGLLEGSFEWLTASLHSTVCDYLRGRGMALSRDAWSWNLATYADRAIVCVRDRGTKTCYQIAWSLGEDGKPLWSGEAKEVEIKPQIIEKQIAGLLAKGNRPQSEANTPVGQPPETVAGLTVRLLKSASAMPKRDALEALEMAHGAIGGVVEVLRDERVTQLLESNTAA